MYQKFVCGECGEFESKDFSEVVKHEENCRKEHLFQCHKCGNVMSWRDDDVQGFVIKNQCHYIDLGRMGYGSKLDEINVNIQLCDSCLCEIIDTFKLKEKIYNPRGNHNED